MKVPRRKLLLDNQQPQPDPKKARRVAAYKAHLTRAEEAARRWQRRLKRALTESNKHLAKVAYYANKLKQQDSQ